jgi:cyclopropane-fatty-acyl-phospholipid synthase
MTAFETRHPHLDAPSTPLPWTLLPPAPRAPVHAAIARRVFARAAARLDVRIDVGGRQRWGGGGHGTPVMRMHEPDAFFRRIGHDGLIGFGESYMAGEWDADDLAALLTPFARRLPGLVPTPMQRARRWYQAHQPRSEANDLHGAKANISRHYDLSNELFALFLDETMTYSSAIFDASTPDESLETAQVRKIDRLLDLAGVRAETQLLEIGTGWGELAVRAACRGAQVTTVTLSSEQQAWALRRARQAGVADRVDVQLLDYRQVTGVYDAIVSVEMIEAVGTEFWPTYFATIDRVLAPGGRAALQAITIDHQRLLATKDSYTWIHKYVFPGGIIPSLTAICDAVAGHTALRVRSAGSYGPDYAMTLHRWLARFRSNVSAVRALGFDERFIRMWEFYLAYCEAGFASRYLDVHQLVLER